MKGYWNKPEATAQTFVDGWVRTGDLARIDEEGFCFIIDRAKDMLIRGGENIYCVEVENVLYDHPAVMDAALVGIPHKTLGEEPGAVVHLKPGMHATRGRAARLRRRQAGRLQGAGEGRLLAGDPAAQRQRQDPEDRTEEDLRAVTLTSPNAGRSATLSGSEEATGGGLPPQASLMKFSPCPKRVFDFRHWE